VDVGSSYLPPDFTGALLCSQLDKMETIRSRRAAIYDRYVKELAPLRDKGRITLPTIPPGVESNHHLFWLLLRDEAERNRAIRFFRERGIGTAFHYLPLHLSGVGRELGGSPGDCPVTESVSGRLLRLPIYPSLSTDEQGEVIAALFEFAKS
jgi:dTDP-4-amino-4,6-dideoxygalactose transaminase